jgi:uncharacterized phage infection (PIP) family protein YhgE
MATLREAAKFTEELEDLASRLHSELTEGQVDFTEMVRLADGIGESADALASTFAAIDEALSQRLHGIVEEEGEEGERGSRRLGQRREERGRVSSEDEEPTKEELLERAKEFGIQGRSGMSKEELQEALRSYEEPTKEELLERAKEAGIAGRSAMSKEELQEALQNEQDLSKEDLVGRAREAGIEGRSEMTKDELREALRSS